MSAPWRLCCNQPHYGATCPDGKVMCCVCFNRFEVADLYRGADGQAWDFCIDCEAAEHG